ncbi:TPA: DMT family transporter [Vibrio vulnificus]|nr:DMT family transporter [Vibrio vulnificus]EJY4609236.1 DMT family transporter [Vibrio vulnificus]EJY4613246.1 DMT family transporter [Vibrio vulnificus]ELV8731701.1 DMT family transporter [Vibrio vulnificus]MBN8113873.1 DMT family transporter [Vibrio vulnificus]MCA0773235.1 DMT family transporter [Vibrio vulnificus]
MLAVDEPLALHIMNNPTVSRAIFLLVTANLLASLSDVSLKILNGEVPTFQYVFIRQSISLVLLLPFWLRMEKSQWKKGCDWITFWRAQLILLGSACAMIAITHLPLATANAMFYVGPLLVLPLAFVFLGERPAAGKIVATLLGFVGVLIVLRPEQFHWAAIVALGSALSMGVGNILIRKVSADQSLISTLFWTTLMTLPFAFALAYWQWSAIRFEHILWIVAINLFVLAYHALVVKAFQQAPASQIALAEYSGLAFVTFFGVIWFDEVPDSYTVLGILLIIVPMMPIRWKHWLKGKRHTVVSKG